MKYLNSTLLLTILATACGSAHDEPAVPTTNSAAQPETFSITSSSTFNTRQPKIEWSKSGTYLLSLGTDSNCSDEIESSVVEGVSTTVKALENGTYYACLTLQDKSAKASNSPFQFKVEVKENDETVEDTGLGSFSIATVSADLRNPTISWTSSANATSYDVKVCSDENCLSVKQSVNDLTTTSATLVATADNHLQDGTYFVQVIAKNDLEEKVETTSWTMDVPTLASLGFDTSLSAKNYGNDLTTAPLNNWTSVVKYGVAFNSTTLGGDQCYGFEDGIACLRSTGNYSSYKLVNGSRYDWTY
jgi:hypothetical protein